MFLSPSPATSRYLSSVETMEATDVTNAALNYGIVVDCGSSGSRVYVYYWPPHHGNLHTLLDIRQMRDHDRHPVVKKIKPGEERKEWGYNNNSREQPNC